MSTKLVKDIDPVETFDWLDSIDEVLHREGAARAQFLLGRLLPDRHSQC